MYEYHAGTRALTWALLVLTDGTLSTHMDTVNDRIRYSEYFHGVLWVPAWGTLDARMHTLSSRVRLSGPQNLGTGMGTQIGYCAYSHRVLNAPTSVLLVLTTGYCSCLLELAGRRHEKQSSELAVRREDYCVGSLLCCVCASGMPLGTASDPA